MKSVSPFLGKACLLLTGTLILLSATMPALAGQEIKPVATRPGVTVQVLLNTPATPAKAVLVMFPEEMGPICSKKMAAKFVWAGISWYEPRRSL